MPANIQMKMVAKDTTTQTQMVKINGQSYKITSTVRTLPKSPAAAAPKAKERITASAVKSKKH
jgi:hypothetical protein